MAFEMRLKRLISLDAHIYIFYEIPILSVKVA